VHPDERPSDHHTFASGPRCQSAGSPQPRRRGRRTVDRGTATGVEGRQPAQPLRLDPVSCRAQVKKIAAEGIIGAGVEVFAGVLVDRRCQSAWGALCQSLEHTFDYNP